MVQIISVHKCITSVFEMVLVIGLHSPIGMDSVLIGLVFPLLVTPCSSHSQIALPDQKLLIESTLLV